jgi:hypothetical protein
MQGKEAWLPLEAFSTPFGHGTDFFWAWNQFLERPQ